MNTGKIVQVIGPVVDVQFAENAIPAHLPGAHHRRSPSAASRSNLTLEVQQHLGGGLARAIAMSLLRRLEARYGSRRYRLPDLRACR